MKRKWFLILAVAALVCGCSTESEQAGEQEAAYRAGAELGDAQQASLATVVTNAGDYEGKAVRLEGTVESVCSRKGCWLVMVDGDESVRVTFKDYGFFVPIDTKPGSIVRIDAEVSREIISEETAKHYAEETPGGDPDAITGPQEVVRVVASGVEIEVVPDP